MELQRLIDYIELTHRFQRIERRVSRVGEERFENDAEHSYQLAMAAWYLNEADGLGMDTGKLLRYALAHDFVEVYAGDTFAYTRDAQARATKAAREEAAAARLRAELPAFSDLHDFVHAYEAHADREARFVYALDKILPTINIYLDSGRDWHTDLITLDMIRAYKTSKVAVSPEIVPYFEELMGLLVAQPGLFPEKVPEALGS